MIFVPLALCLFVRYNFFFWPLECAANAFVCPLFVEGGEVFDSDHKRIAIFSDISSPQQLEKLQPSNDLADIIVVNLLDWQVS